MHSQKYLFHQIVDEIYKKTLHKFETCMLSMHMRYKTNQIDDSIPFVRTHIEPMFAPSGPVRAPLAPLLRPRAKSEPASVRSSSDSFPASAVRARPSFSPARIHIAHRPPPAPGALRFSHPDPLPLSSARPRPHRSPELSPAVPPASAPRPKTHNPESAQHDDGPKS